jgi:hypothetical protein
MRAFASPNLAMIAKLSKLRGGPLRLSWVVLIGLAACSPYDFSKEVGAFSTGVDQLSSGFTSGYTALAADRAALVQLDLTTTRAKVVMATSCLALPSKSSQNEIPCALYRLGDSPPARSKIEQTRKQTTAFLKTLKDYAQALVAVTNAADRATYNAAVAQLASTVGTIAKDAGPQGAAASTVVPAAVNLIGWLVGTALDQQRLESLKAGVIAVSTPLPDKEYTIPINYVARVAGAGLFALALAQREVLVKEINILTHPLGPSLTDAGYRQGLSNAQAVVTALDGLRQTDPTAAAEGLIQAHQALVAAVNDPSQSYATLVKAVGDFADQAAALHTALTVTPAAKSTTAK